MRKKLRDLTDQKSASTGWSAERQIAQKIIDLNFRINRITAIENNMLNFDMSDNEPDFEEDEGIVRMIGPDPVLRNPRSYEARLSKQLLQYQKELERLQALRALQSRGREGVDLTQTKVSTSLNHESASFGKPSPPYVMSAVPEPFPSPQPPRNPLPPPDRLRVPQAA
jgi:hypothetical protein